MFQNSPDLGMTIGGNPFFNNGIRFYTLSEVTAFSATLQKIEAGGLYKRGMLG